MGIPTASDPPAEHTPEWSHRTSFSCPLVFVLLSILGPLAPVGSGTDLQEGLNIHVFSARRPNREGGGGNQIAAGLTVVSLKATIWLCSEAI